MTATIYPSKKGAKTVLGLKKEIINWCKDSKLPCISFLYHIGSNKFQNSLGSVFATTVAVKAGMPAFCLPVPDGTYHALYIYVSLNGKLERKEKINRRELRTFNKVITVKSIQQFEDEISEYYRGVQEALKKISPTEYRLCESTRERE